MIIKHGTKVRDHQTGKIGTLTFDHEPCPDNINIKFEDGTEVNYPVIDWLYSEKPCPFCGQTGYVHQQVTTENFGTLFTPVE